ncbi:MAG: response regulator [Pseudomonadota bacterium]
MAEDYTILMLEDEPLILLDLEFAAEDRGCRAVTATNSDAALKLITQHGSGIDLAILDVSLGGGNTCFPVAHELDKLGIPYILHSGDLDRHNERIRKLQAQLVAKPASAAKVIAAAIAHSEGENTQSVRLAAE